MNRRKFMVLLAMVVPVSCVGSALRKPTMQEETVEVSMEVFPEFDPKLHAVDHLGVFPGLEQAITTNYSTIEGSEQLYAESVIVTDLQDNLLEAETF